MIRHGSVSPQITIVAGPNGSGKSTLIHQLVGDERILFPDLYINADDIAAQLAETMPEVAQEDRERDAFRQARALRIEYRNLGVSHAFETAFSHPSTLIDMRVLHELGFNITVHIVTTERPEINVERVARRVREGGHNVPVGRILDRYHRFMRLLPCIVERADSSYVYDSSRVDLQTGDPVTRLVAAFRAGIVQRIENIPNFLSQKLVIPLHERAEERQRMESGLLPGEAISPPDEAAGVYSGAIRAVFPHYCLQQTSPNTIVRHDTLLLTGPVIEGETVTIAYKDGYGTPRKGYVVSADV